MFVDGGVQRKIAMASEEASSKGEGRNMIGFRASDDGGGGESDLPLSFLFTTLLVGPFSLVLSFYVQTRLRIGVPCGTRGGAAKNECILFTFSKKGSRSLLGRGKLSAIRR